MVELSDVAVIVACLMVLAFAGFLAFLHWRNAHPASARAAPRPAWQRRALLFVQLGLVEVVSGVFSVFAVIDIESYNRDVQARPPRSGAWRRDSLAGVRVAFYVLLVLKLMFIALNCYVHLRDPELPMRVAARGRGYVRADWMGVLEGFIFLPIILVEGMMINAELFLSGSRDVGDVFPFDSVVLLALDIVLFFKLQVSLALESNSTSDGTWVDVVSLAWAISQTVYELLLVVLFILFHLASIPRSAMELTLELRLVIVSLVLHPFVASFSSLMAWSITQSVRALRSAPKALVAQLVAYLRYFSDMPQARFLNVACYGTCLFLYVWPIAVASLPPDDVRNEATLRVGILTATILFQIINAFYLANLIFAILKRLGPHVGARPPFDTTSYASAINQALSECNANFRVNNHMRQVAK